MLITFKCANYRSFKNKVTLDLRALPIKEYEDSHVVSLNQVRLLKSAVLFGPNASGKSNLISAMRFMRQMVESSTSKYLQRSKSTHYMLDDASENVPTEFEVEFMLADEKYRYGFTIDKNKVHKEWLYLKESGAKRETYLIDRNMQDIKVSTKFKEGRLIIRENKTRDDSLFLSVVSEFNGPIATKIVAWFERFNVTSNVLRNDLDHYTYNGLENAQTREPLVQLIKAVDTGLKDVIAQAREIKLEDAPEDVRDRVIEEMNARKGDNKEVVSMIQEIKFETKHFKFKENGYEEVFFNLGMESVGTQKFIALAGAIIESLANGEILIVDELDNSFHSKITEFIVKLFNSEIYNKNNAQLIFATHDTNLLSQSLFRRDQIWFSEKDIFGASTIFPLIDFGVRKDKSLEKNYLAGEYGAIPNINNLDIDFISKYNHSKKNS